MKNISFKITLSKKNTDAINALSPNFRYNFLRNLKNTYRKNINAKIPDYIKDLRDVWRSHFEQNNTQEKI